MTSPRVVNKCSYKTKLRGFHLSLSNSCLYSLACEPVCRS